MITLLFMFAALLSGCMFWVALGHHYLLDSVFYGMLTIVFSCVALNQFTEDEDYGD